MNNRKTAKCGTCGKSATAGVSPEDWNDAPANFTITIECSGRCPTKYLRQTPEEMRELTGLPLSGWAS